MSIPPGSSQTCVLNKTWCIGEKLRNSKQIKHQIAPGLAILIFSLSLLFVCYIKNSQLFTEAHKRKSLASFDNTLPGVWWYESCNRHKVARIFTALSERALCLSSQILSEASSAERAPREGPRGQRNFSLQAFFSLSPIPRFAHSLTLFALLRSTCSHRCFYTSHRSLNPYFSSFTLCFPTLFSCLSFSSWMLMTTISLLPSCSSAKITDYREKERERERERQRERERGFTFPEKPNLSNLQCCCAWQPNRVAFFFLTQRQSTASAAHTHAAPNQRRRIFLIFFVVVEFCSELAAMWPLPQMLRRSKPARINISSLSLSQLLHNLMPADQWRIYNVKLLNLSPDSYEHGWWQRPEHEQWRQNAHTHKHTHIHTHLRSTCLFTDGWLNVQHIA